MYADSCTDTTKINKCDQQSMAKKILLKKTYKITHKQLFFDQLKGKFAPSFTWSMKFSIYQF